MAEPIEHLGDEQLVGRIATGDERALAVLHERYVRLALAIAQRIVRDPETAREVTQDAFLDLWRTAPEFDPARASATTWLARLVRLRAIDRCRRGSAVRRGEGVTSVTLDHALDIASGDDVAGDVQDRARAERVRRALNQLPVDQRSVVELAFLGDRTHAELAALLDLPLGTVKTRCFRGLARLAELLADERGGAIP